jgi:hypothetical protein
MRRYKNVVVVLTLPMLAWSPAKARKSSKKLCHDEGYKATKRYVMVCINLF